ncbi:hypothetical protein [Janthinobacterium fluminis]|uniref:Uncharacterized protein n=1 Tax=Janthinobacterium fluminis TaxID=2987524 RepID=A0ABT5JZ14_9BURK|nr:hypothetical protein [Janthinobacterium fluminis]MDC8757286.1 hypothetical protein [Janthinobacterium fluminis]
MSKQKSGGDQSKQSGDESASRGGEPAKVDKRGKDAASTPKSGGKGGAKQKQKRKR